MAVSNATFSLSLFSSGGDCMCPERTVALPQYKNLVCVCVSKSDFVCGCLYVCKDLYCHRHFCNNLCPDLCCDVLFAWLFLYLRWEAEVSLTKTLMKTREHDLVSLMA